MASIILTEGNKGVYYPSCDYFFSPDTFYPEYPWGKDTIAPKKNEVYELVRRCFLEAGLDKENFGLPHWNPLGVYLKPGQTVLIKPNWVENKNSNLEVHDNLACLVTHPSVVRVVLDYVCIALNASGAIKDGRVILADAPMQQCDLQDMFRIVGYDRLFDFFDQMNRKIEIFDLRKYSISEIRRGVFTSPKMIENSPGSVIVNMNDKSLLAPYDNLNTIYKVSEYRKEDTAVYHSDGKHIYEISKASIMADVIINIPKPKTHRLAGMTGAIKNMVGITYEKASLPHRRQGAMDEGGDAYLKKSFWKSHMQSFDEKKTIASTSGLYIAATFWDFLMKLSYILGWLTTGDKYRIGSWYGNDTIWRTSIDLNYALLHADKNGVLQKKNQRTIVTIADMIVCGQGSGPVGPHPKPLALIMMSDNSLLFDRIMCEIMGFDKKKVSMFNNRQTYERLGYSSSDSLENENVLFNGKFLKVKDFKTKEEWKFDAHPCWKGHIEKDENK